MSGPYRSPLHGRKKVSTTNFIYTLYTSPWKGFVTNTDDLRVMWDSPNIKTRFPGSKKPRELVPSRQKGTLCHSSIRRGGRFLWSSNSVAWFRDHQKPKQAVPHGKSCPVRFIKITYLPADLVSVKTSGSRKRGFQFTQNTESTGTVTAQTSISLTSLLFLPWNGSQIRLFLVPLTLTSP